MKTKKFNFTDIVLILAIIAVVCGFAFRKPIEKLIETNFFKTEVTYVLSPDASDSFTFDVGTEIFDDNGQSLGTVSKINFTTEEVVEIDRITVITQGIKNNSGVYIGDKMFIAPGVNINIRTNDGTMCSVTVKTVKSSAVN